MSDFPRRVFCQLTDREPGQDEKICGRPAFSNASDFCEKHFANIYPGPYARMMKEVRCPECGGLPTRSVCLICFDRGWVDPTMIVSEPEPVKKAFDPPREKTLADEDGVVIELTAESVGF